MKKYNIKAITPLKVIRGHRCRYQSKARPRIVYVTDISYLVPFRSYRRLLFKCWTLCVFEPPFGWLRDWLRDKEGCRSWAHWKARIEDFLYVLIELFSLDHDTADAPRAKMDRKSAISRQRGHFDPKFQVEGVTSISHFRTDS